MPELRGELVFTLEGQVDFNSVHQLGDTPVGSRLVGGIAGGSFEGPRIRGEILPGYGDWMIVRPDGVRIGDIRMALRTHDGEIILVSYRAVMKVSPEVHASVRAGERVDESEYYLRSAPVFETASTEYGWLNEIVSVGIGTLTQAGFTNTVFAVL
jgi:hypothetical protein